MILPDGTLSLADNASIEQQSFSSVESVSPPIMKIVSVTEAPKEDFCPMTYLQSLSAMFNGKHQYMLEMLEILLQQIPVASEKMEHAIAIENWQEVFFESHRIKSTLKIAGLQELVDLCIKIESRTRIIATDELHLIPAFFEKFQTLIALETPRLETCVAYLNEQLQKNECAANDSITIPPSSESDSVSATDEITFLLP